ncbi:hypothetical protein [uncultured Psychroserpens sp.]|uniref:hypothetical protein n=1 Tax=uncultured Psychroserpens sp. TaxID=255436 RepID=UPI002637BBB7|nr:hypothetical protein [uncultured Psychroserpens sp.]
MKILNILLLTLSLSFLCCENNDIIQNDILEIDCSEFDEYAKITIDEDTGITFPTSITYSQFNENIGKLTMIFNSDDGATLLISGKIDFNQPINSYEYLFSNTNDQNEDLGFYFSNLTVSPNIDNTLVFNVTNIGVIDEYIDINFAGEYYDATFTDSYKTIVGCVHVLRDN